MSKRNKVKIYSIITANHGKKKKILCSKKTEAEIYKEFHSILKNNKKEVIFPVKFNNINHEMLPSDHELIIIKCKDFGDSDVNKVRDNTGAFVNYQTDNEDWIVIDRAPYEVEETFWVYGFHPQLQRKTFMWVFENFILKNSKDKYSFKTVQVYNNKVLIECGDNLEMVICKNKSDSARFYNMLEEFAKEHKCKYVAFMGDIRHSKYKGVWIEKIMKMTGWNYQKIIRLSTRD